MHNDIVMRFHWLSPLLGIHNSENGDWESVKRDGVNSMYIWCMNKQETAGEWEIRSMESERCEGTAWVSIMRVSCYFSRFFCALFFTCLAFIPFTLSYLALFVHVTYYDFVQVWPHHTDDQKLTCHKCEKPATGRDTHTTKKIITESEFSSKRTND